MAFLGWTLNASNTLLCYQQTESFLTGNIKTVQQAYLASSLHISNPSGSELCSVQSHFLENCSAGQLSCTNFPGLCLLKYLLYCPQKSNQPDCICGSGILPSTCYCIYLSPPVVSMWVVWREIYTLIFY